MGRGSPRRWWPLSAVAVITVAAAWLLYAVWRSPHGTDQATFGAFAFPVVVLLAGWGKWAWQKWKTDPIGKLPDAKKLHHAADQLALAVRLQWEKAAAERGLAGADPIKVTWARPSLPMAGPLVAAVGTQRFDPLPGMARVGEEQLSAGQIDELHALYGGLGSGRLIIAGPPGSGKSGAAVLLVLAALRHREQVSAQDKHKVPVPILVTAQDWDPRDKPTAAWLCGRLQQTYPLFIGATGATTAAGLIATGKIAVIIDGLDEIDPKLRSVVLQALNEQASFRVVVLSRSEEMASAASCQGVLQGAAAIELRPIAPVDAVGYLERVQLDPPPGGWHDLIRYIRNNPASPLSKALDSPLTLTLVRDTYQPGDDVRELLEFSGTTRHGMPDDYIAEAVSDHLLNRVLRAAYTHRPGQQALPYDLPTAQNALTKIAAQMNTEGTRDLQWWHIPEWIPSRRRLITGALAGGLAVGLGTGLYGGIRAGLTKGAMSGLEVGITFALAFGFLIFPLFVGMSEMAGGPPRRIGKFRVREMLRGENLFVGLLTGIVVGLVGGLRNGLTAGLVGGSGAGFGVWFGLGLTSGFTANPDSTDSMSPAASWAEGRNYGLAAGLGIGLAAGLGAGFAAGVAVKPGVGLRVGTQVGIVSALAFGVGAALTTSGRWPVYLTTAQLAIKWRTPVRLMKFLNDAHNRNILRTVGPNYQFRHARLQDHLAAKQNWHKKTGPANAARYPVRHNRP